CPLTRTNCVYILSLHDALPILKLELLKAIHNFLLLDFHLMLVVNHRKTRTFESNSQPCSNQTDFEPVVNHRKTRTFESNSQLIRSEEHTSELQSRENLVCRLLL